MSNNHITPEDAARMEAAQRRVAEYAERDPELVAAVATAFAAGLQIGESRAKQEAEHAC